MPRRVPSYQIEINQGNDFALVFLWKVGATLETVAPVNLTLCTARMTIWTRGGDELLLLTTENGGLTLGDAAGTIALEIDADDTLLLTQLRLRYIIEVIFPNDDIWPFLRGDLVVVWRVPA